MKPSAKKATVAKEVVKTAAKPAAKSATSAPAKKTAAVAAKKPASPKKAAVQVEPPATFISASIDIGFGNHLYIRGEGSGLSWDRGIAMDCVGNGLWTISLKNATAPIFFKILVNDLTWSVGNDYIAEPGQSLTIYPTF